MGWREQHLFRAHMKAVAMTAMTSTKATPSPTMTLCSSVVSSDFGLSCEPCRRGVRAALGGHAPPHPHDFCPAVTHQHHEPQLQQLRQRILVLPDHPAHRAPLRPEAHGQPPATPRAAHSHVQLIKRQG